MLVRNLYRRFVSHSFASLIVFASVSTAGAQATTPPDFLKTGGKGEVGLSDGVFTLYFSSTDGDFPAATAANLADTFFRVIGPESEYFNAYCPHVVEMIVENPLTNCGSTTIAACAYTDEVDHSLGHIRINGAYIDQAPEDWDLVTHEAMHVVQDYPWGEIQSCMYWPEGLADFGRDRWGVHNTEQNWSLPAPAAGQTYAGGDYGSTAAFLRWIEATWGPGPILTIQDWLMAGTCPPQDLLATQTPFPTIDAMYENYLAGGNGTPSESTTPTGPTTPTEPTPTLPPPTGDPQQPGEPGDGQEQPGNPGDGAEDPGNPGGGEEAPGGGGQEPGAPGEDPDEPEYPDESF